MKCITMGKIVLDISMSLDGFIAGSNISSQLPMGENGMKLHDWLFDQKTAIDEKISKEMMNEAGVVIVGRRTYNVAIDEAWDGASPFSIPAIIISHGGQR